MGQSNNINHLFHDSNETNQPMDSQYRQLATL